MTENEHDWEQLESLREALNLETPTHKLGCWTAPSRIPGLGWVAGVTLFSLETYQGPWADVLLAGEHATLQDARDEALAAVARLVELGLEAAHAGRLGEALGLRVLDPHDPEVIAAVTGPDASERRAEALRACEQRFDAVAARMHEVYGLRLPRSLIPWAALVRSLNPIEREGLDFLGRRSGGIMIWFEDGGLERETRDGLDPRLEGRFRCDPPEFVTIGWGDSDGLHFGLWYDDPAELPTTIVSNYARDSAETGDDRTRSMLEVVREQLERVRDESDYKPRLNVEALADALEWFRAAETDALAADGPSPYADIERPDITGGMGPALGPEHGDPRGSYQEQAQRYELMREPGPELQDLVDQAFDELERGLPAFALVLGRELHWVDADATREVALELMVGAYEALGRHALAEIAKLHHAHRDLRSVGVY